MENSFQDLLNLADKSFRLEDYENALKLYLRAGLKVVQEDWSFKCSGKIRGLVLNDVDNYDGPEIIVTSEDHFVYALGKNGNLKWKFETEGWAMCVDMADTNDNNMPEIIVGADKIYVLDKDGVLLNEVNVQSSVNCLTIQRDSRNKLKKIIVGHENGQINCLDINGNIIWTYSCKKRIISLLSNDIDHDGNIEIVAATEEKKVYILTNEGGLKDIFESDHWILNIATADLYDEGYPRLVIASFEGSVHVYKYAKTAALEIKQHGILGMSISRLISDSKSYQIILGSADKGVSIIDIDGKLLWRFNTSYGHRVLSVSTKGKENNQVQIVVGGEDGFVHSYSLEVLPGLVQSIQSSFSLLEGVNILRIGLSIPELELLNTFVLIDPINRKACLEEIDNNINENNLEEAIDLLMELRKNNVEFCWNYKTGGRIYALDNFNIELPNSSSEYVLAGSGDGNAYAINLTDGSLEWKFKADKAVRGVSSGILSETNQFPNIVIGSVDRDGNNGNVYMLDYKGTPIWNFQTQDWVLYTKIACVNGDGIKEVLYGSDGHYVGMLNSSGQLIWKCMVGDRVRAVTFGDINKDGINETIIGSDDKNVYIIDANGQVLNSFQVPHWILTIEVKDIDNDGESEIMVGTEDGFLYVYSHSGNLKWSYKTGHWIAALSTFQDKKTGECFIVIGSADRWIYCLNNLGIMVWTFETSARVRTIMACDNDESINIIFGSYDNHIYNFKICKKNKLDEKERVIKSKLSSHSKSDLGKIYTHELNTLRAFSCDLTDDISILLSKFRSDKSELVKIYAASKLIKIIKGDSSEILKEISIFLINIDDIQLRLLWKSEFYKLPIARKEVLLIEMIEAIDSDFESKAKTVIEIIHCISTITKDCRLLKDRALEKFQTLNNSWILFELDRLRK
ncbi:MAG: PQQ-like beta-propeller repeat protein [Flavobacteriaceae bacterium]|nr:PQQ-like beta-propeller repeat protein [Flavobacteriaceae bacterium]